MASVLQVCVQGKAGRLFTLFLTSPVIGMAALAKLENADGLMLAACQVTCGSHSSSCLMKQTLIREGRNSSHMLITNLRLGIYGAFRYILGK